MNGTLVESVWYGGPWDGVVMNIVSGEEFFPLYTSAHDDEITHLRPARARPTWMCPVVEGPDGRLFIDWNHRIPWVDPAL